MCLTWGGKTHGSTSHTQNLSPTSLLPPRKLRGHSPDISRWAEKGLKQTTSLSRIKRRPLWPSPEHQQTGCQVAFFSVSATHCDASHTAEWDAVPKVHMDTFFFVDLWAPRISYCVCVWLLISKKWRVQCAVNFPSLSLLFLTFLCFNIKCVEKLKKQQFVCSFPLTWLQKVKMKKR